MTHTDNESKFENTNSEFIALYTALNKTAHLQSTNYTEYVQNDMLFIIKRIHYSYYSGLGISLDMFAVQ